MNTAQDWLEMCIVKRKLDNAMNKITDMFIDVSDGCEFKNKYVGNSICSNIDHIDNDNEYIAYCKLEKCPIIENGIVELDIADGEGEIA